MGKKVVLRRILKSTLSLGLPNDVEANFKQQLFYYLCFPLLVNLQ